MRIKRLHMIVSITCSLAIVPLLTWLPPLTMLDDDSFQSLRTEVSFNTPPPSFGKTHFIFGYKQDAESQPISITHKKKEVFPLTSDGRVCSVLFAPDQKICKKLVALIDREKKSIRMAAYMITDKRIAIALCRAQKRGVQVEVIVDPGCLQDRSNKIAMLHEAHVPVYVYMPSSKGMIRSLMHDKFVLFGETIYHRHIIWTGSANFTCKADEINQENVIVFDDSEAYKKYTQQFDILKKRSERYEESLVTNAVLHERLKKQTED